MRPRIAIVAVSILLIAGLCTFVLTEDLTEYYSISREYETELANAAETEMTLSAAPGGNCWDFLQDSQYSTLVVEVDGSDDVLPPAPADCFEDLNKSIAQFCEKDLWTFVWNLSPNPDFRQQSYSSSEIKEIAKKCRDFSKDRNRTTLHVLILEGTFRDDKDIRGLALDASTIVLFPRLLSESLTRSLLVHEFGHILGLVNLSGAYCVDFPQHSSIHDDEEHPGHCDDPLCYMNHEVLADAKWCDACRDDLELLRMSDCPYYSHVAPPSQSWERITSASLLSIACVTVSYALLKRERRRS